MTKKLTKEEMRHDAFRDALTTAYRSVEHSFEHHWKLYLGGLALFIVLFAAGQYAWHRVRQGRDEASFRVSRVVEAYGAPVLKADDKSRDVYRRQGTLFFDTDAARAEEVQKRLAEARKAGGPEADRKVLTLYAAMASAREGRADEALSQVAPLVSDGVLAPVAVMFQARVLEAKRDAAGAEAAWKKLSTMTGPGFPEGSGLELLAEYYERSGQPARARETWAAIESALKGKVAEEDALVSRARSKQEQLKGAA